MWACLGRNLPHWNCWNGTRQFIGSFHSNLFVSDVKPVNSGQPTPTDNSSTVFFWGGAGQLGPRAGLPSRGQRVLLTQENSLTRNFTARQASQETVVVLRVGDAWLVGVGKRAPHGFRCPCLVSSHGSLDRLKSLCIISSTLNSKTQTKQA